MQIEKKEKYGVVDLLMFNGASNVQNAGKILKTLNPCITVGHGAEHVVSLFFSDIYTKVHNVEVIVSLAVTFLLSTNFATFISTLT
jgi:hypothetical protein